MGKLFNLSVSQFLTCKWCHNSYFICHDDQVNYMWNAYAPVHSMCSELLAIIHFWLLANIFIEKDFSFQFRILPSYECFFFMDFFPPWLFLDLVSPEAQVCDFTVDLYFRIWGCIYRWSRDIPGYYYSPFYPPKEW